MAGQSVRCLSLGFMPLLNGAKISRLLLDMDPGQNNMSETHSSTLSSEQVEVKASVTHQKSFLINNPHKWKWSLRWDLLLQVRPAGTEERFMIHCTHPCSYCTLNHTFLTYRAFRWFHSRQPCGLVNQPAELHFSLKSVIHTLTLSSSFQIWIKLVLSFCYQQKSGPPCNLFCTIRQKKMMWCMHCR